MLNFIIFYIFSFKESYVFIITLHILSNFYSFTLIFLFVSIVQLFCWMLLNVFSSYEILALYWGATKYIKGIGRGAYVLLFSVLYILIILFLTSTSMSLILHIREHGCWWYRKLKVTWQLYNKKSNQIQVSGSPHRVSVVNAETLATIASIPDFTFKRFILNKSSIYCINFQQIENKYKLSQAATNLQVI